MSIEVKLSAYEIATNNLNKLPLKQDRIFSAALAELKGQRDLLKEEVNELRFEAGNERSTRYEMQEEVERLNKYTEELRAEVSILVSSSFNGSWSNIHLDNFK